MAPTKRPPRHSFWAIALSLGPLRTHRGPVRDSLEYARVFMCHCICVCASLCVCMLSCKHSQTLSDECPQTHYFSLLNLRMSLAERTGGNRSGTTANVPGMQIVSWGKIACVGSQSVSQSVNQADSDALVCSGRSMGSILQLPETKRSGREAD